MKLEELSTERLREEKRKIEAELSKRYKANEDGEDMLFQHWLDRTYVERKEEKNDKDN